MNGIGLVLAGGGGKGAYFIGVWKALREYGVDKKISAISGTSVGALNGVLFAQGSYCIAEELWKNIKSNHILKLDLKKIVKNLLYSNISIAISNIIMPILPILIKTYSKTIFSREGLEDIIENNVNLSLVSSSSRPIYAATFNTSKLDIEYIKINRRTNEDIKKILLASSALPIIFEQEKIDESYYYDGGIKDNVPIKPLYDEGIRNFIVVHLSRDSLINKSNFEGANIIEIVPQEDQGNLINGTLDFSKEGSEKRINQGYNDTIRILEPIYQMNVLGQKIEKQLDNMKLSNDKFNIEMNNLRNERLSYKNELEELLKEGISCESRFKIKE